MLDTLQLNKILDKGGETHHQLFTPWGERIAQEQTETVLTEYPRPQMARKNYKILNGFWKYAITGSSRQVDVSHFPRFSVFLLYSTSYSGHF